MTKESKPTGKCMKAHCKCMQMSPCPNHHYSDCGYFATPPQPKLNMTGQYIIGDDGEKEELCIHGIGHGGIHTCDGCCQPKPETEPERRCKFSDECECEDQCFYDDWHVLGCPCRKKNQVYSCATCGFWTTDKDTVHEHELKPSNFSPKNQDTPCAHCEHSHFHQGQKECDGTCFADGVPTKCNQNQDTQPTTMTELRLRMNQEDRERVLRWLQNGEAIGQTLEINIDHFTAGQLGKFVCEIKEWKI